jgi:signal transduction histidine kinase/ligand-binding sensor domain-containing protein
MGSGLDRFDPATNTFTHYRHNSKDQSSLNSDTVTAILEDHAGNLWVGGLKGLDCLNRKTGKFIHFTNKPGDDSSLSYRHVNIIYEDRQGTLWVGCGNPTSYFSEKPGDGGLNRFDKNTGKFTRYLHDPNNSSSLLNNKVKAIFEDSKGNFWVGTAGDGLHIMDRMKGSFTHYFYDPAHPEKLSRPRLFKGEPTDNITFINEDVTGAIWIGTLVEGINRYNPSTKKLTHYGLILLDNQNYLYNDTLTGYSEYGGWCASSSKEGVIWISTLTGNLYNVNPVQKSVPYYTVNPDADCFYEEGDSILWIGTDSGLLRKNRETGAEKRFTHQPGNPNSISSNSIGVIRGDVNGNLWIGTDGGLNKLKLSTNKFTIYRNDSTKTGSLSAGAIYSGVYIDHDKNLWVGTIAGGLNKMKSNGEFIHYRHSNDTNSISSNYIVCISEDKTNQLWIATGLGVNRLDERTGIFHHYLQNYMVKALRVDSTSTIWAGTDDGVYFYDQNKNNFLVFNDPNTKEAIPGVLNILADYKNNLWVSTRNAIVEIYSNGSKIKYYGENYGVHSNTFFTAENLIGRGGEMFFGDQTGYYAFFPEKLMDQSNPTRINFTSFKLGEEEVKPTPGGALQVPIWLARDINLNYTQNVFSLEFSAIHFTSPGNEEYSFMLENYDDNWRYIGTDHKAYFFNVPPGKYDFKVRAINSDGTWGEKGIKITITPPWWRTWWAYILFALLFAGAVAGFIYYRSRKLRSENRLLEEKVAHRTAQLDQSLENLRSTQSQLIQSEKMASLGELTAGIAHEIQNPLNFVNNFSDVNTELLNEMEYEMDKGNIIEAKGIAKDIMENEKKINHHGKRADAIVKGMLQHSQSGSGKKELTNINALADEYLRLAYHGFRAREKTFNTIITTDYSTTIGNINIIPKDIGRVLLNVYNNAFYAVSEKKKQLSEGYEPAVSVSTKKVNGKVEISVKDNGNGIPQKVLAKIFQPFFTTKPTGQGTGLGLSLSYDIIKVYGGEIRVDTKEGEFTEFVVQIPAV